MNNTEKYLRDNSILVNATLNRAETLAEIMWKVSLDFPCQKGGCDGCKFNNIPCEGECAIGHMTTQSRKIIDNLERLLTRAGEIEVYCTGDEDHFRDLREGNE